MMGDSRRFMVFADWITRQFPRVKKVADIATGKGDLSLWLHRCGYQPVAFDRRPSQRVQAKHWPYHSGDVAEVHFGAHEVDVVVAMHPDGATWHAVRLAKEAGCPFAIVPCCPGQPNSKRGRPHGIRWNVWLEQEARRMGFEVAWMKLRMNGKNLVLKGWLPK